MLASPRRGCRQTAVNRIMRGTVMIGETKTVTAFPLVTVLTTRRRVGGQGRGRTADLPLFRRTLVPTELPALSSETPRGQRAAPALAVLTGLEPATSALTG